MRPPARPVVAALIGAALGVALPLLAELLTLSRMGDDYHGDAHEWWIANFAQLAWAGALAASVPVMLLLADATARALPAVGAASLGAAAGLPVAALLAARGEHLPSDLPAGAAGTAAYGAGLLLGVVLAAAVAGTGLRHTLVPRGHLVGSAVLWAGTLAWANLPLLEPWQTSQPALPGWLPMLTPAGPYAVLLLWPALVALVTALFLRRKAAGPLDLANAVVVPYTLVAAVLVVTDLLALPGYELAPVAAPAGVAVTLAVVAATGAAVRPGRTRTATPVP